MTEDRKSTFVISNHTYFTVSPIKRWGWLGVNSVMILGWLEIFWFNQIYFRVEKRVWGWLREAKTSQASLYSSLLQSVSSSSFLATVFMIMILLIFVIIITIILITHYHHHHHHYHHDHNWTLKSRWSFLSYCLFLCYSLKFRLLHIFHNLMIT